jgi:hypothetical protein
MRRSLGIGVVAIVVLALAVAPAGAKGKSKANPALVEMNETLAAMGENVRASYAEFIVTEDAPDFGAIVFANDRGNKQLDAHWVPFDPNRWGVRDIYWATDQVDQTLWVAWPDADAAIDRAMQTWQDVQCSTIPLTKVDDWGLDLGYVQYLLGKGGVPGWLADITQAGWLPRDFFDLISVDGFGGDYILGVTFTFIWIDDVTGEPTDMDGNGKDDVAFREIYYNDNFVWGINVSLPNPDIDVESIVLHETGHGLSQAHFGKIFLTKNGKLHFAPYAVMNAAYWDMQQVLTGTDVGGHCSIWGSWPNN